MANGAYLTEHLWLVNLSYPGGKTIPGHWAASDGPELSGDVTTIWDGGETRPVLLPGTASPQEIAVSRPYVWDRDHNLAIDLLADVMQTDLVIAWHPTKANLQPWTMQPIQGQGLLRRVKLPNTASGSNTEARIELTIALRIVGVDITL